MKPAPFDYYAPTTIDEALKLLDEACGGAQILAGGQTLMPLLNLRMAQPFILMDINKIPEIQGVARGDDGNGGGGTWIRPITRQNDGLADETLARHLPILVTALSHVGHHQTRNRGTIGGSVSLGEPAAEMPATAVALGAEIEIRSLRGTRRVPADEFYLGPYLTVLEPDEMVTGIFYPDWPSNTVEVFREVATRPGDFALVGLVGGVVVEGGRIARAGIAWFGMGPTPIKARQAIDALVGAQVADLDCQRIAELAVADTNPFDDSHATAEYRRTVGRRIFAKTLAEALNVKVAA